MLIRCERCSTLYELDEALLSGEGSQVQCSRCQHVFTAFPPRAAGRAPVGAATVPPQQEAGHGPSARPPPWEDAPRSPAPDVPRPGRSGSPSVYRPPAPAAAPPPVPRAPILKRDTMGAFEARLRARLRWKWLGPGLAVGILLVVAGAWIGLSRRADSRGLRDREQGIALLGQDDSASLEKASRLLDGAAHRDRRLWAAAADAALARTLWAANLREDAQPVAVQLAAKRAERERVLREVPPSTEAEAAIAAEVRQIEQDLSSRQRRARELFEEASGVLQGLETTHSGDAAVRRALAVYASLAGNGEETLRLVQAAGAAGHDDPWILLAEANLDAQTDKGGARDRALVRLGALAAAHPEILRARYLLARMQAEQGRRSEAVATLDGVLAANPAHDRAGRLRAELVAPQPVQPIVPSVPASPAPEAKPGLLPRNTVAQPATPAAPRPPSAAAQAGIAGASRGPSGASSAGATPRSGTVTPQGGLRARQPAGGTAVPGPPLATPPQGSGTTGAPSPGSTNAAAPAGAPPASPPSGGPPAGGGGPGLEASPPPPARAGPSPRTVPPPAPEPPQLEWPSSDQGG